MGNSQAEIRLSDREIQERSDIQVNNWRTKQKEVENSQKIYLACLERRFLPFLCYLDLIRLQQSVFRLNQQKEVVELALRKRSFYPPKNW